MSNAITEEKDRELPPNRDGEIKRVPTPAVVDLQSEVLDASRLKEAGQGDAMRARSSIESRTDLRLAATNEAMRAEPTRTIATLQVEQDAARRWVELDSSDFGRIRSDMRRQTSLEAIAGHVRVSPEYAEELKKRSPVIADAARALNEERAKVEREAAALRAQQDQQAKIDSAKETRSLLIDAAALAVVAALRGRETAKVVERLAISPDTTTQQLRDAQLSLKAPPLDGRVTAPNDPDIEAQRLRTIKRPVVEEELNQTLLTRYIVSQEKRGLFDKTTTEFTHRSGEQQGRIAFVDTGKSLSTELEDKSTIRAMVEVATAKNWKEVTVGGSDDFRRNPWLEASLNNLKVRGYEPRESDKQMLVELQERQLPRNAINVVEREAKRDEPRQPVAPMAAQQRHVDGDALTPQEKTVIDNSRAFLNSKALGDKFTDATLRELEAKPRGERVYAGEILAHGKAPFQNDKTKDDSYYVTLKTSSGEQVIWGKGLGEAMRERTTGEQIVLQNIGKRDVTVQERVVDAQGQFTGTRLKETQLNAWTTEPLSRFILKAQAELTSKSESRAPAFGVYDSKAPRAVAQPDAPNRFTEQQRSAEATRKGLER